MSETQLASEMLFGAACSPHTPHARLTGMLSRHTPSPTPAADKENLKTHVAQELLAVRQKEMKFYAANLSMVGTHSALLAGFAFTILSQYKFKAPVGGVFSAETHEALGMARSCDQEFGSGFACQQTGVSGWTWDTWMIQICQALHLILTTMGMCVPSLPAGREPGGGCCRAPELKRVSVTGWARAAATHATAKPDHPLRPPCCRAPVSPRSTVLMCVPLLMAAGLCSSGPYTPASLLTSSDFTLRCVGRRGRWTARCGIWRSRTGQS